MKTDATTTSYALLGLLATRPFTAYELTHQMRRGLRWAWPRSEANLYSEAKRLVALGYARSRQQRRGRRTRTRYEITKSGRAALREWLAQAPATAPRFEAEILLRLFFADHGSSEDLAAAMNHTRDQLRAMAEEIVPIIDEYIDGEAPFPERAHLVAWYADFVARFYGELAAWLDQLEEEASGWESPAGARSTPALRERFEAARRSWRAAARVDGGNR